MALVMREVTAHQVLRLEVEARFVTVTALKAALEAPPYSFEKVGYTYLTRILSGAKPLPGDELLEALLHILGLGLEDIGLDPGDRPGVWLALEGAKLHGWPQRRPPDPAPGPAPGPVNGPSDDQVNRTSCGKQQSPARRLILGTRLATCLTSQLGTPAAA